MASVIFASIQSGLACKGPRAAWSLTHDDFFGLQFISALHNFINWKVSNIMVKFGTLNLRKKW